MSELNKSYVSANDEKKIITIQDTGFLIQYPGYFRGKPHFLGYDEIKNVVAIDNGGYEITLYLKNNRELKYDGMSEYECEKLKSAFQHGQNGALSADRDFSDSVRELNKKSLKDKIIAVVGFIALMFVLWILHLLID